MRFMMDGWIPSALETCSTRREKKQPKRDEWIYPQSTHRRRDLSEDKTFFFLRCVVPMKLLRDRSPLSVGGRWLSAIHPSYASRMALVLFFLRIRPSFP